MFGGEGKAFKYLESQMTVNVIGGVEAVQRIDFEGSIVLER